MERLSTGFVDALNTVGCVKDIMANSVIHAYTGTQPVTADAVETGTLLAIFTVGAAAFVPGAPGNGLNMGLSVAGVLSKAVAEEWKALGLEAAGTGLNAGWFRWYDNAVVTGESAVAIRVDGAIGTSDAHEIKMSNPTIVQNGPSVIQTFTYTSPKQ